MKILLLILSIISFSFEKNEIISSNEFNQKFTEINSFLNQPISFRTFNPKEKVVKEDILKEFYKLEIYDEGSLDLFFQDIISSSKINELFNTTISSLNPILTNLNPSCNCYKDIFYSQSDPWNIDGGSSIGDLNMDVYLSNNPNGEVIIYSHPMNKNKELNSFELNLKNQLNSIGYTFVSIEFRHPILEQSQINLSTDQFDIIKAIKKIRTHSSEFNLNNKNDISSVSFSKGSIVLANILSEDRSLKDIFGIIQLKKMYLLDSQVTYNYDTYYEKFINKNNITIYSFGVPIGSISALDAFNEINNASQSTFGFSLTTDLNVIDSYRNINNIKSFYPELRFAFNQKRESLISPADLTTSLIPLVLDVNKMDYFLHNPEGGFLFCSEYLGICNIKDDLKFNENIIINDILEFFNQ